MALLNKSYKFPNQLQHDTMQCGVACLEMICKYYKKNILQIVHFFCDCI
ncbi:cysteine peptidase family C39 domain-containing protein [Prevotella multiformis]